MTPHDPTDPHDHTEPIPEQPEGAGRAAAEGSVPAADTEQLPPTRAAEPAWAQAVRTPGEPVPDVPVASDASPATAAPAPPAVPVTTTPHGATRMTRALRLVRWSGKTAVAVALAVGLGVGAAVGATAAYALGSDGGGRGDTSQFGPAGDRGGPGGRGEHDGDRRGAPGTGQSEQGGSSSDPSDANGSAPT